MKKTYSNPIIEVTTWTNSDVITTSGPITVNNTDVSSVANGMATVTVDYEQLS